MYMILVFKGYDKAHKCLLWHLRIRFLNRYKNSAIGRVSYHLLDI